MINFIDRTNVYKTTIAPRELLSLKGIKRILKYHTMLKAKLKYLKCRLEFVEKTADFYRASQFILHIILDN